MLKIIFKLVHLKTLLWPSGERLERSNWCLGSSSPHCHSSWCFQSHGQRQLLWAIKYCILGAWWLILCVNLTGLWDAETFGQTLFWVSVKVFLDQSNIWTNRVSKKIALPPYCGWASSDQLKTWIKPKGWVRGSSSCPTGWPGTLVFPGFWTQMKTLTLLGSWACWTLDWNLAFLVPRFPDSNWDYTSALLGLQLANCRSWNFKSHNLMSQFLIINLLIDR